MSIQKIDATFSPENRSEVMSAIAIIRKNMPFLGGLTAKERQRLSKIGRKSQTFVTQAFAVAENHPELMPGCWNLDEARRDLELFEALSPILQAVSELRELIEDTQIIAGSEAYGAARLAYQSAKTTGKNLGLEDVVSELSMRFRKTRKNPSQS